MDRGTGPACGLFRDAQVSVRSCCEHRAHSIYRHSATSVAKARVADYRSAVYRRSSCVISTACAGRYKTPGLAVLLDWFNVRSTAETRNAT